MANKDNTALRLATLFNKWIAECTSTHSKNTIRSYVATISLFLKYLEEVHAMNVSTFCAEKALNRQTVVDWLDWLANKHKCSAQTCNVRLANLRGYVKYIAAIDTHYRAVFIDMQTVEQRKVEKHKVEGMSKKAVKYLLKEPDTSHPTGLRDAVMISLLYTTATRLEELSNIRLEDLNLDIEYPYVVVKGKGSKIRTLSIPPKMVHLLRKYLSIFHEDMSDTSVYLFYSKIKGKKYPITQVGISKRLKIYATEARKKCNEVPLNLHAHQLRHARATHWLDDGLNIAQVSRLLGHENIATTMIYLDITEEIKSKAISSRMNKEIKDIKPKWTNRDVTSLMKLFGL